MSCTPQMPTDDRSLDPAKVFERYLWTNPEVCNGCFERIRSVTSNLTDLWGNDLPDDRQVAYDGTAGTDVEDHDRYGALLSHRGRHYCGECGSAGGRADDDALSRRQALDRVDALVERLQEQAILVDDRVIRRAVRHMKSIEEIQGYDREIFARAVKIAVERSR